MKPWVQILAIGVLCSLLCGSTHAQPPVSTNYQLQAGSSLTEGCLDPCLCPIWMVGEVQGGFGLSLSGMDGDFYVYEVLNVSWVVVRGTEVIDVMGSGSYRLDPETQLQQLELDLEIAQNPVEHFDSGLVPIVEQLPKLNIAAALNGFYCYDEVFEILAAPAPVIPTREASWGTMKAQYDD